MKHLKSFKLFESDKCFVGRLSVINIDTSIFFYRSDEPVKVNPLKRFGKYVKSKLFNEKIVDYDSENIKLFYNELSQMIAKKRYVPFNIVSEIGKKNDIEVVDYDTFRSELPNEQAKKDAPPRNVTFALVNPNTKKARIVMSQSKMDKELLDHCYHMLKHENIHIGQFSRRSDEYSEFMGNVMNKKQYYSNKDEIMAFSQSISDKLMDYKPLSIEDALSKLNRIGLYYDIKTSVDADVLNRYKKYIYLYLEKEFEKTKK